MQKIINYQSEEFFQQSFDHLEALETCVSNMTQHTL